MLKPSVPPRRNDYQVDVEFACEATDFFKRMSLIDVNVFRTQWQSVNIRDIAQMLSRSHADFWVRNKNRDIPCSDKWR